MEYGGAPLRLPGWVRCPRWLSALARRPSRGAAILGIAGLIVGLAAGYALGYRHLGQAVRPSRATAAPSAAAGSAPSDPAASAGDNGAYSSSLSIGGLSRLAQTGGACSVQRGQELQVGVEVINPTGTAITLGQVKPILPLGGLRPVSQQWAPCGAISSSGQAGDGGAIIHITASTGELEAGSAAGATVLPPYGTAWLSVTFRVLVACPGPLPVQFSVSYQQNGRTDTVQLPGFPDLGQVTYTGCKGSS